VAAIKVVESGVSAASARSFWLTLPLGAVGTAALLQDSWPGALIPSDINLRAIFGALLWLSVVVRFGRASLAGPPLAAAAVHELRRRLSRQVYLLLYLLFGASQIVRIAALLWNGGHPRAAHPAILPPPENLQDYLAYGVFALLSVHAIAAAQCQALKRAVASAT
jgi:cytochrome b561